jgi:chromosome segregation ATPase
MDEIDTSKEEVAKRLERLESLAERGWIDGDVVDLVSALSAERGQLSARLAACERERDDARVELAAIRAAYDKATGGKTSLVEAFDNLNATITHGADEMSETKLNDELSELIVDCEHPVAGARVDLERFVLRNADAILSALRAAESPAPTEATAQKESFVRGEMGMAAADRAQTTLKRPPDTRDGEIAELRARLDTAWEAVRIRDETINAKVKTRDATIATIATLRSAVATAREALGPFVRAPLVGDYGGPLVCADLKYEDGSSPDRSLIGHEAFDRARSALAALNEASPSK